MSAKRVLLLTLLAGGCTDAPAPDAVVADAPAVDAQPTAADEDVTATRLVKIIKGDEVIVATGGEEERVRLVGIYAFSAVLNDPQVEALAAGSVSALTNLLTDVDLTLVPADPAKDETGRTLAYIDVDGVDVGRRMIELGWAVAYTEYPFAREREYRRAEANARARRTNLWGLRGAAKLTDKLRRQWNESRTLRAQKAP